MLMGLVLMRAPGELWSSYEQDVAGLLVVKSVHDCSNKSVGFQKKVNRELCH